MVSSQNDLQTFRDYLLGRLRGEDLTAFEERLLTDKKDFEELLAAAEDDLTDEYVGGQLSREEREAFETHYLITPERHDEIDFARSLDRFFQNQTPVLPPVPPRPKSTWILRVAALVLVLGVTPVVVYRSLQPAQLATITINPSSITRGGGPEVAKINVDNADTLRVVLNLPPEVSASTPIRAELENNRGESQAVDLTKDSQTATVDIPTRRLRKGQHAIKLFTTLPGMTERRIATYFFTVE